MDVESALDVWINDIEQTRFEEMCSKPSVNSWSLGQLCMHLIDSTDYFLGQIPLCLESNKDADQRMTGDSGNMFMKNEFPNKRLEGPPSNADTVQANSKEYVLDSFRRLKQEILKYEKLTSETEWSGKTKHPGLGYFNASEWLQFIDMHFRHHLRQKSRIKAFLELR